MVKFFENFSQLLNIIVNIEKFKLTPPHAHAAYCYKSSETDMQLVSR